MIKKRKINNKISSSTKAILNEELANSTDIQWAHITPNKILIATEERVWLSRPRSEGVPFAQLMEGVGSIATTRRLLDGAIAAAKYAIESNIRPPALTSTRWIWRLASAYHLCSITSRLMEEACVNFSLIGHWNLAEWAAKKANEEAGHDRLALLDIQSLGYDAEAVVEALVPPAAVNLIDYFTRSVQDDNPIDCVGYTYTMERLSLGIGEEYIQKVEALLPLETYATRCLRVHSSVGADADHVDENVSLIAGLTPSERTRIARACYETALMCFSPPSEAYISDEELQQILQPLKLNQ